MPANPLGATPSAVSGWTEHTKSASRAGRPASTVTEPAAYPKTTDR
jgi:hypothetical protein